MRSFVVLDIETTGLDPLNDRVTCVGLLPSWCVDTPTGLVDDDEQILVFKGLSMLKKMFEADSSLVLVTFNGERFDLPFLLSRLCLSDVAVDPSFFLKIQRLDLMKIGEGFYSLNNMAAILGVQGKNGKGLDAIRFWNEGKHDELRDYCLQDCKVVYDIIMKMYAEKRLSALDGGSI